MIDHASQRQDVFRKDRRDLLHVSQIVAVFSSLLICVRLEQHAVEGDACNPLVDDAYNPTDMTLSTMRSTRISSTKFSNVLCSPNIHTHNQIARVGEQTREVI
jgi:hypothetical protein